MSLEAEHLAPRVRRATPGDIPFLAWCNYEASSPAPGVCYWDGLLEGLNTETMTFIRAVFEADALAWGRAEEFFLVEEEGKPIAGASAYAPDPDDFRPLRASRLPSVANLLGWDAAAQAQFRQRYESVWSDPRDPTIAPQAPWIIECMAVVPEARGRGVARALLKALLDEGRRRGHAFAGISVTNGNEPAQRAYQAAGFKMYMAYGAEYFDGAFPGTTKYRLRLN